VDRLRPNSFGIELTRTSAGRSGALWRWETRTCHEQIGSWCRSHLLPAERLFALISDVYV